MNIDAKTELEGKYFALEKDYGTLFDSYNELETSDQELDKSYAGLKETNRSQPSICLYPPSISFCAL